MENLVKVLESGTTNDIEQVTQDLMNSGYSAELLVSQASQTKREREGGGLHSNRLN